MWDTFLINPATNALLWIYSILGNNFGIAIIVFTILIRLATWPLNASQMKSAKVMQDLQQDKDWQAIQKKYKDDKEKLAQEQMRVYQEKGINPFASCLPMLIQFPIIIGLYQALSRTLVVGPVGMLHLVRAISWPALNVNALLPLNSQFLWMDLGRPESVQVFGFPLPTLAIIVALTTYLQSKLTMPAASTGGDDQTAAMTSNYMTTMMPLMFGWMAMTFSSGLSVYFITSNLLGIIQYAAMGKVNWRNLLPGGAKKNPPADIKKKK